MHNLWGLWILFHPVRLHTCSLFLLILCAAGPSIPAELAVTVEKNGSSKFPAGRGLRLVCDSGDQTLVLSVGPDRRVSVPKEVRWLDCRIDEDDFWSQPVQTTIIGKLTEITVPLWPAAEVRGRLVEPDGWKETPMRIYLSGGAAGDIDHPDGDDCTIDASGFFSCPVPATRTLDAKIRLAGHISHFYWGLDTAKGVDLGERRFLPGASVTGRVEVRGPCDKPQSPVVVRLTPLSSGWKNSQQEDRLDRQAASAETGIRGFFHFDGIEAGKYTVSAEKKGCGSGLMSPVTVNPRAETMLREPLVLSQPCDLEILVTPPVDPWGTEWRAELVHITALSGARKLLDKRVASKAGAVRFDGLSRGPYRVSIIDARESSWAVQPVDLEMALERLKISVDLVEVTGTVLSGDTPIEADLVFGGKHGSVSIRSFSNNEGRFDVVLPREGRWTVDVAGLNTSIRRTIRDIEVYDGADVKLLVGDRFLKGHVVNKDGRPFPGAEVSVETVSELGNASRTLSGENGTFSLGGLEREKVVVRAEREALSSDDKEIDLTTENAEDVELVMEDRGSYILTVLRGGWPVPGARAQHVVIESTGLIAVRGYTADLDGRIEIPLKAGEEKGSAVVIAQGAPVQLISLDRNPSPFTVSLEGRGGSLSIPVTTFPLLRSQGAMCPLPLFSSWANIMEVEQTGNMMTITPMAAGFYEACQGITPNSECSGATLQDGVAITLD